jgi:hypothetical protein
MNLVPHPDWPPSAVEVVHVSTELRRGKSVLVFSVAGEASMEPRAESRRANDLWQRTCFEMFVKPVDHEGYFEFNFAPSTEWAAYRLAGYRAGMTDLAIDSPVIERLEDGVRVTVDLSGLPDGDWRIGLSAVIEAADGTKSYWALGHPPGQPDFHDPACFALELPAPQRP